MLDYGDFVTIKVTKVKNDRGEFSHWEADTSFSDNWYKCEITSPTFYGATDEAFEYIRNVAQYWTADDANGGSYE